MEMTLQIIYTILIGFVISRFEILDWIFESLSEMKFNQFTTVMVSVTHVIFTCMKCLCFWIGLLVYGNIIVGCIAFIVSMIYDKFFSKWERNVEV